MVTRYLQPGGSQRKRQDLLRSWGTPIVLLPCSPTPAGPTASGPTMPRHGPRSVHGRGSRSYSFRGSITRLRHWLSTLRSAGCPYTTQDSLPAVGQTLPDGLGYPQGSDERFQGVSYIRSSFPKLTQRKVAASLNAILSCQIQAASQSRPFRATGFAVAPPLQTGMRPPSTRQSIPN